MVAGACITLAVALAMLSMCLFCQGMIEIHRQLRAIANAQALLASRLDRVEERIQRLGRKVGHALRDQNVHAGATTDPRTAPIPSSASQLQRSAEGSSSGQPRSSTGHLMRHPKPHERQQGHRHGLHGGSSLSTLHELQNDPAPSPRRTSRNPQMPMSSGNRF